MQRILIFGGFLPYFACGAMSYSLGGHACPAFKALVRGVSRNPKTVQNLATIFG